MGKGLKDAPVNLIRCGRVKGQVHLAGAVITSANASILLIEILVLKIFLRIKINFKTISTLLFLFINNSTSFETRGQKKIPPDR